MQVGMEGKGMSANETVNFLCRVYDDLSAADGFVGITPEQIMREKVTEALSAYRLHIAEVAKPVKGTGVDRIENAGEEPYLSCRTCRDYDACDCSGRNAAIDEYHTNIVNLE